MEHQPERLRPHELAAKVTSAGYEVKQGRVESERLGGLIRQSETVWRELAQGRFDEDEFGYATIGIEDWVGDYRTESGDHVDALNLHYHDPNGNITPLGRIARLESYSSRATVYVAVK